MNYTVVFGPLALEQLDSLEAFVGNARSFAIAARYADAIVAYCESLAAFPQRGIKRDDLFPGLRVTNYRGSTSITFIVSTDKETVSIVGIFYGGQDYEAVLQEADYFRS